METINIKKDELIRRLKLVPHEMINEELFRRLSAKEWVPEEGEPVLFGNEDGNFDIGVFEGLSENLDCKVFCENTIFECENIVKPAGRFLKSCPDFMKKKRKTSGRMSLQALDQLTSMFAPAVQQLLREVGIANAPYYAVLLKHDDGLSGVELAKITNRTADYIRTCMSTLIKKGLVRREGNKRFGCYHAIREPEFRRRQAGEINGLKEAWEDIEKDIMSIFATEGL